MNTTNSINEYNCTSSNWGVTYWYGEYETDVDCEFYLPCGLCKKTDKDCPKKGKVKRIYPGWHPVYPYVPYYPWYYEPWYVSTSSSNVVFQ